jgi:hypothetical protein
MKDIMLDQLQYYMNLEFTVLAVEGMGKSIEEGIKKRFAVHKMEAKMTPVALKVLDNAEYKWLLKSEHYAKVQKVSGPYLKTGSFEIKSSYQTFRKEGFTPVIWDLGSMLIYNGEFKKRKSFDSFDQWKNFITEFEGTFEVATTTGHLTIAQANVLAEAYCDMFIRQGRVASKPSAVASLLIGKQNEYMGSENVENHRPFFICNAYANYLKTVGDPMFTTSLVNFIKEEKYLEHGKDETPETVIKLADNDVVKLFA